MLESYRLEVWNGKTETVGGTEYPPNGLRMAFLDSIDFNSVQVSEDLVGGHRIEFRAAYDDPALEHVTAFNYLRLVDLRTDVLETTITAINSSTGVVLDATTGPAFLTNLAIDDVVTVNLADTVYRSTVNSIDAASVSIRQWSRGEVGTTQVKTAADHAGRTIQRTDYRLYRIKQVEYQRDQQGILSARIQADHFSYDMANLPFIVSGRADIAYSQNQLGASRPSWEQDPTSLLGEVLSPFSNSFAAGRVDFSDTSNKEAVFRSDSCLRAARSLAPIWEGDLSINEDGLADLLYFKGRHSGMSVIYGRNLESLSKHQDASELATEIYPVGASSAWEDTYTGLVQDFHTATYSTGRQTSRQMLRIANNWAGGDRKFRVGDVIAVYNDVWATGVVSQSSDRLTLTLDATKGPGLATVTTYAGLKASAYRGGIAFIYSGTEAGQIRNIVDNGGLTVTLDQAFGGDPTGGEIWLIRNPEITEVLGFNYLTGTATSGTSNTLTDSGASFGDYTSTGWIEIASGTGLGQVRAVYNNTSTVITVASDWDTTPDSSSVYMLWNNHLATGTGSYFMQVGKLKRQPSSASYETGGSTVGQYGAGGVSMMVKVDTEEPLTVGKSFNYRSSLRYYHRGGTNAHTVSLVDASESSKFTHVGRVRINEYLPTLTAGDPAIGIPVKQVLETRITSISNNYLILPPSPISEPTTGDPTTFASVEAVTFKDQTASDNYGQVSRFVSDEQIHRPDDLANKALKTLAKSSIPKTRYSVKFGELYEIDPILYDTEKANVGDLFDVYDESATAATYQDNLIDPNEFQIVIPATARLAHATDFTVIYYIAGGTISLIENQYRGAKLGFGRSTITLIDEFMKFYAVVANTDSQIVIERMDETVDAWAFEPANMSSTPYGGGIRNSLRIIEKSWNPFDPRQMTVEVSNAEDMMASLPQLQLKQDLAGKKTQTGTNNANIQANIPVCMHWSSEKRRCVRSAPPNWFCNSIYANKDGKLTDELKPITKAMCKGFQTPVDRDLPTVTKTMITTISSLAYDASATNPSSFTTISVDLPVIVRDASQVKVTPIGMTKDADTGSEVQKPPRKLKYKIKLDGLNDLKPYDPVKGTGIVLDGWQMDGNDPDHEGTYEISLTGSDASYYYDQFMASQ